MVARAGAPLQLLAARARAGEHLEREGLRQLRAGVGPQDGLALALHGAQLQHRHGPQHREHAARVAVGAVAEPQRDAHRVPAVPAVVPGALLGAALALGLAAAPADDRLGRGLPLAVGVPAPAVGPPAVAAVVAVGVPRPLLPCGREALANVRRRADAVAEVAVAEERMDDRVHRVTGLVVGVGQLGAFEKVEQRRPDGRVHAQDAQEGGLHLDARAHDPARLAALQVLEHERVLVDRQRVEVRLRRAREHVRAPAEDDPSDGPRHAADRVHKVHV